jgi:hypothetical protein
MISDPGTEPIIYAGNEKIAQRHINASLLARFFDASEISAGASVFESLGTGSEFFGGDGEYSFETFEDWIQTTVLGSNSAVLSNIAALLPSELTKDKPDGWEIEFVRDAAEEFRSDLAALEAKVEWSGLAASNESEKEDLLSVLLDDALLPTFSFPIDVCDFIVRGADADSDHPKTKYEMSRDLTQALSTYVPGREIVVDKKSYQSYGLYFKFAEDQIDRASGVEWSDLDWLNYCPRCGTVFDNPETNMSDQGIECSVCSEDELVSMEMFTPSAFAPEVDNAGSPQQMERYSDERVYATQPKYPLTPTAVDASNQSDFETAKSVGRSTVGRLQDEQLLVANFGPDDEGFEVCQKCGAVGTEGLENPHNRPYPKDIRHMDMAKYSPQCNGSAITTSFSHTFPSDLTVFRIPLEQPMRFEPDAEWFDSAAQSLAEALVMAASVTLDIEDNELEGGYRTRSGEVTDQAGVDGIVEIFLFDTTSGGAGFSSKVWEQFHSVLEEAGSILNDCKCDTACHDCLQRYGNRHRHGALNRHLGAALLQYGETGSPPELEAAQTSELIQRLTRSLELQMRSVNVSPDQNSSDRWTVSHEGATMTIGVRSCLRERRDDTTLDADFDDYQLAYKLPTVANEIQTLF